MTHDYKYENLREEDRNALIPAFRRTISNKPEASSFAAQLEEGNDDRKTVEEQKEKRTHENRNRAAATGSADQSRASSKG